MVAVLLAASSACVATSAPSAFTYESFIARVRACNARAEASAPPQNTEQWRQRALDWGRCMKSVSDRMPARQKRLLEDGMHSCNARFPYATKPGDNIHCLREVIHAAFPGTVDARSRYRMMGAEIAGHCEQLYPSDTAAELACIHAGLHKLTTSGAGDQSATRMRRAKSKLPH